MALDAQSLHDVTFWIASKCQGGSLRFAACGGQKMLPTDAVNLLVRQAVPPQSLPATSPGYSESLAHRAIPAVLVVCPNCGYMAFFATAVMGFDVGSV